MSVQTLSEIIQSLGALVARKKALAVEAKDVDNQITDIENLLFATCDEQGITEAGAGGAKIVLSEAMYPQVESWDLFGEHILDNRAIFLLERRPAVLAYRELLSLGRPVPGVLPFTKRKLTYKET